MSPPELDKVLLWSEKITVHFYIFTDYIRKKFSNHSLYSFQEVSDVCIGTSIGTITEPDCLGPCEPGTSVTLEGIVWHETEGGKYRLFPYQKHFERISNPNCWEAVFTVLHLEDIICSAQYFGYRMIFKACCCNNINVFAF